MYCDLCNLLQKAIKSYLMGHELYYDHQGMLTIQPVLCGLNHFSEGAAKPHLIGREVPNTLYKDINDQTNVMRFYATSRTRPLNPI